MSVELDEFTLELSSSSASSGEVSFAVDNVGQIEHDFWVLRTDLAADDLPVTDGVVETGGDVEVVEQIEGIQPEASEELMLDLEPGPYVLICNIAGHYQSGMVAALDVS